MPSSDREIAQHCSGNWAERPKNGLISVNHPALEAGAQESTGQACRCRPDAGWHFAPIKCSPALPATEQIQIVPTRWQPGSRPHCHFRAVRNHPSLERATLGAPWIVLHNRRRGRFRAKIGRFQPSSGRRLSKSGRLWFGCLGGNSHGMSMMGIARSRAKVRSGGLGPQKENSGLGFERNCVFPALR